MIDTPTNRYLHDIVMSLHRHAYKLHQAGSKIGPWYDLVMLLCKTFADCPAYQQLSREMHAWDQIWRTAGLALQYEMPVKKAFPLCGEILRDELCTTTNSSS